MSRGFWQVASLGAAGGGLTTNAAPVSAWSATDELTIPGTLTTTKLMDSLGAPAAWGIGPSPPDAGRYYRTISSQATSMKLHNRPGRSMAPRQEDSFHGRRHTGHAHYVAWAKRGPSIYGLGARPSP